jgi:hypothetical protein
MREVANKKVTGKKRVLSVAKRSKNPVMSSLRTTLEWEGKISTDKD